MLLCDRQTGQIIIRLYVSVLTLTYDEARILDISEPETSNLMLHAIPYADSILKELLEIVNNPVFKAEDLSLKPLKRRLTWSMSLGQQYRVSEAFQCFVWGRCG